MKYCSMHYGSGSSLITGSNNKVIIGNVCVYMQMLRRDFLIVATPLTLWDRKSFYNYV